MATGTDPFAPRTPLTRELLERYAAGLLRPEERHAVELHLEQDPLLREAAEGLQVPGAVAALEGLGRKNAGGSRWARLLGLGIVVGVLVVLVAVLRMPEEDQHQVHALLGADPLPEHVLSRVKEVDSTLEVVHAEIATSTALPESLHTNRSVHDRFLQPDTLIAPTIEPRTDPDPVERLTGNPVIVPQAPDTAPAARIRPSPRPSRRTVFLHDLKVVHPKELYGSGAPMLVSPGVPADRVGVRSGNEPTLPAERADMAYLDYMDEALGAFVAGRQRAALDDLYFLLAQYPEDVNARFYAGLCCYDLGLFARAKGFFSAVASDPVDTFNEEAEWYLALTLDRSEGHAAALPILQRIAEEGGFYAEQARKKMR